MVPAKQQFEEFENCPPNADALIQSIRSFGYDLGMAIADIIDNSITAGAKNIQVTQYWGGANSYISILDDGGGMDEGTLVEAMRLGTTSPLEERDKDDLGRFGLGLKTASFSQCRLLTVRSKTGDEKISTRCWDLDCFKDDGQWPLRKSALPDSAPFLQPLEGVETGTIILWQKLDRIVEIDDPESEQGKKDFLHKIEDVQRYLEMVFHRYTAFGGGISIFVNSPDNFGEEFTKIKPWDPFCTSHPATQELSNEAIEIFGDTIRVRPYVLPHISKLSSKEHGAAAGPRGWNAQQGFYVYRKSRLIVAGGWLNLDYKLEDHYKLARIQIDIPNNMDHEWKIDVKKAMAHPPDAIKKKLKRLAKLTREKAMKVYRHRGQIIQRKHDSIKRFVWLQKQNGSGNVYYRIDRDHPVVKDMLNIHPPAKKIINHLLNLVEKTVPIEQIVITNADRPDSHITRETPGEYRTMPIKQWFLDQVAIRVRQGLSRREAMELVCSIEPFNQYPELIAMLDEVNNANG